MSMRAPTKIGLIVAGVLALLVVGYFLDVRAKQQAVGALYARRIAAVERKSYVRTGPHVVPGASAQAYLQAGDLCPDFGRAPTMEAFVAFAGTLRFGLPPSGGTDRWPAACAGLGFAPGSPRTGPAQMVTGDLCRLLVRCAPALDLMERGTAMAAATSPTPAWPLAVSMDAQYGPPVDLVPLMNLARLTAMRGYLRSLPARDVTPAVAAAANSIRVGQDLGRGGSWGAYELGLALMDVGLQLLSRVAAEAPTERELRALVAEIDALLASQPSPFEAILAEYAGQAPVFVRLADVPMAPNHPMRGLPLHLADFVGAHQAVPVVTFFERALALEGRPFPERLREYRVLHRELAAVPFGMHLEEESAYLRADVHGTLVDTRLRLIRLVALLRLSQSPQGFYLLGADVKHDPLADAPFRMTELRGNTVLFSGELFTDFRPFLVYGPDTTDAIHDALTISFPVAGQKP
jgi:hypothetical protein